MPDYPVQGHIGTIQHLLSHTSGIPNYTELPEWQPTLRNDVSVQQLIDVFKDRPRVAAVEMQPRILIGDRARRVDASRPN